MKVLYIFTLIFFTHIVESIYNFYQEPVTLDTKLTKQGDDIEKIVKFKGWTIYKVKDPVKKRIGEVRHGPKVIVGDSLIDIIERVVYIRVLNKAFHKYVLKIMTKYKEGPKIDEFILQDSEYNIQCKFIVRTKLLVNISSIDSLAIASKIYQDNWIEYSVRSSLSLQYRIGNVIDGDTQIVSDSVNDNIRSRYLQVSRKTLKDNLKRIFLPFLRQNPTIVRVFTYYYEGERTFDEYIEIDHNGIKKYVELIRIPTELNISGPNPKYFRRKLVDDNYVYFVPEDFKNRRRMGKVVNNYRVIVEDEDNIKLRSVYINKFDKKFETVDVKTCYKRGDCKRCKYIIEDNKYIKSTCDIDKETERNLGSQTNLYASTDQIRDNERNKVPDTHLQEVVSFRKEAKTLNDIVLNLKKPLSGYFDIDLLPNSNGLFYTLDKNVIGRDKFLKIMEGEQMLIKVHLDKVTELSIVVKNLETGKRKIFMWLKCGIETEDKNEVIIVDPISNDAVYISRKIEETRRLKIKTEEAKKEEGKKENKIETLPKTTN